MSNNFHHTQDIKDLISDPEPLWLWDGIAGRIYWANDAGLDFWRAQHVDDFREMQFDHAMPALRRLRKLALSEIPDRGQDERLLFWTAQGNRQVICNCLKLAVDGYGDLLLLRLKKGGDDALPVKIIDGDMLRGAKESLSEDAAGGDGANHLNGDERRSLGSVQGHALTPNGANDIKAEMGGAASGPTSDPTRGPTSGQTVSDENDVAATLREIARQVRAESKISAARKPADIPSRRHAEFDTDKVDRQSKSGDGEASDTAQARADDKQPRSIDDVEFLAKISHEVRTPLNSIMGFSELMMQERFGAIDNAKYAEYISDIYESAELALSLINDMLDLSRMNAGEFDVKAIEIDLNGLARSMASIMRPQAEKNAISLKIELAPDEIIIGAGLRSVKQILLNLLSNAIKFTPRGGCVTLLTGMEAPDMAFVKIRDTGAGMTGPQIEKAMRPFAKLDTGLLEVEGTGLGLPITKALVDANGGSFAILSQPGEGTEVTLRFAMIS